MGFIKHFQDDFRYNTWPKGFDPSQACCKEMSTALKEGTVDILSNWKYTIDHGHECKVVVLNYCPWCSFDLRP